MAEEVKNTEAAEVAAEAPVAAAPGHQAARQERPLHSERYRLCAGDVQQYESDLHRSARQRALLVHRRQERLQGSRKSTAYAAQVIAGDAAKKAQLLGMKEVEVRIKGPGAGRESAVRGIAAAGLEISTIKDITPVPHNGCRPPKRRRV